MYYFLSEDDGYIEDNPHTTSPETLNLGHLLCWHILGFIIRRNWLARACWSYKVFIPRKKRKEKGVIIFLKFPIG